MAFSTHRARFFSVGNGFWIPSGSFFSVATGLALPATISKTVATGATTNEPCVAPIGSDHSTGGSGSGDGGSSTGLASMPFT
jgi:hypothetical protein